MTLRKTKNLPVMVGSSMQTGFSRLQLHLCALAQLLSSSSATYDCGALQSSKARFQCRPTSIECRNVFLINAAELFHRSSNLLDRAVVKCIPQLVSTRSSHSAFSPTPPLIFTRGQKVWNLALISTPLFFEPPSFRNETTNVSV